MAQTVTRVIPDGDYPTRTSTPRDGCRGGTRRRTPPTLLAGEEPASAELAAEYDALKKKAEADARRSVAS